MYHDGLVDKDDANANEQIEMAEVPVVPAVPEVAEPIQTIQAIDDDMMVCQFLCLYNVLYWFGNSFLSFLFDQISRWSQ